MRSTPVLAFAFVLVACAAPALDDTPPRERSAEEPSPSAPPGTTMTAPAATPAHHTPLSWASETEHAELAHIIRPIVEPEVGPARLRSGIPGVGVGVVKGGRSYFFGFGEARPGVPVTRTTMFEIGSITKTVVGLVLADEVARGRVELDAPANSLLPRSLQLPSRGGKMITLRHLATHRAGLPSFIPSGASVPSGLVFLAGRSDATRADLERWLPKAELESDPGTTGAYSNVGAALLGLALEAREGRPWQDLVRDVVTGPLGMTATTTAGAKPIPEKATGFDAFARPQSDDSVLPDGAYGPAGALVSNIEDMVRYAALQARAQKTPLDEALRFAQRRHGDAIADLPGVELGLFITRTGPGDWPDVATHSGATDAFIGDLHAAPKVGLATVVLTNRFLMKSTSVIPAVEMSKAIFAALGG